MYLAHYKGVLCDKDLMGFVLPLSVEWKMGLAKLTSATSGVSSVSVQFQLSFSQLSRQLFDFASNCIQKETRHWLRLISKHCTQLFSFPNVPINCSNRHLNKSCHYRPLAPSDLRKLVEIFPSANIPKTPKMVTNHIRKNKNGPVPSTQVS